MSRVRFGTALLAVALCTASLSAATFVVPDDESFIRKADVIVTGTIVDAWTELGPNGHIYTVYQLRVSEVLKGSVGDTLSFREFGGVVGDRFMRMSGSPEYLSGESYLVFFDRDGERLRTLDLVLGQFRFVRRGGDLMLERKADEIGGWSVDGRRHVERPRHAGTFLSTIRRAVPEPSSSFDLQEPAPRATDLDTEGAASIGTAQWSSGSVVSYQVSGSPASGNTLNLSDGQERIIFDHASCDEVGDADNSSGGECIPNAFNGSGTVATAFYSGTFGPGRINIVESDIVIQNNVMSSNLSQDRFNTTLTHEIGHTLGFRHSNRTPDNSAACNTTDCDSAAIMNSSIVPNLNGVLQSWDSRALSANYAGAASFDPEYLVFGSGFAWHRGAPSASFRIEAQGPTCDGPAITQQPTAVPSTINSGESSTLSVSATPSQGSLAYQWFRGSSGQTGNPVAGGTTASISVSPTANTTYWVRVSDGCTGKTVNSSAVTVTVNIGCQGPSITQQPAANPSLITIGGSSTLSVSAIASEGSLSHQWFIGNSGITGNPVPGGTTSSVEVSPSTTTTYWVRVSDECNGGASRNSNAVTVSVCQPAQITVEPQDASVESGKSVTLSVGTSGSAPLTIRWYQGTVGNISNQVGTSANLTVSPTQTTQYWVRVGNGCGTDDSRQVTVTVSVCQPPQITQQPQAVTIQPGQTATLTVAAGGTSLVYQWFQVVGGSPTAVGGATSSIFTTPTLDASATYFVRISNSCGTVESNQASVTVSQCSSPTITQQPQSVNVRGGTPVVLGVSASGTAPLSYQWFRGQSGAPSVAIPGATSSTLDLGLARETESYWVRVTNECGSIDSATATVTVEILRRRAVRRP